uniref:Ribonuclease H-like domain-containing protein n=1 Tax=Tanacetum cinerariifolium TaxID=118510 RepID=A0A6L2JZX7_TANCI|nr:ribonuclease H-like domain-containing protein [Tanacetum cinerariifolium]
MFESASDSSLNESEEDKNQANDRYKAGEGYHAVPPPYTGNFMPPRPDLSFAGLDDSIFKSAISETVTSVHETETRTSKTTKENENTRKSVIEQNTYKQAENLRKSQNSRVDKRDWNGMMAQKLRDGFKFKKKACFVCGSLNHLFKDYKFYENKMVGKSVLKNKGKATGQREVRPVWNNAQRVNHQNFSNNITHPHPKRNFVSTAVITNLIKVPVNTAKQSSPRAASSTSTARYVNTATTRPIVNDAKPSSNVFHKSHSPVRRTFNQRTAPKNSDLKEKINTAKVNNVTTVRIKAVVSVVQGNEVNTVKSSACWIWRPTGNVINHIFKDSRSYMLIRFNYVDLQGRLKPHSTFSQSTMDNLEFCDTHNMVACLLKTEGSECFHQIVVFLNSSHIKYVLTENSTIYTLLIQQFWQTAAANTLDTREVQITATINGKVKLVSEASIRRHIKLEDSDGISTLHNTKQVALMSNIATAIIFLDTNRTFNFSKMIFEGMLKNLDNEAASTGVDVRHRWAATTVSSLDAGQGNDLQQTNKVYSAAVTKLIIKVKKLKKIVKSTKARRRAKIVMSDDEDAAEDTSKQGRKIDAINQDLNISLVQHDAKQRQERASYEAAVRFKEQLDEEERQRITWVHEEASSFNVGEWENIQATIEANEELALRIQAEEREKF